MPVLALTPWHTPCPFGVISTKAEGRVERSQMPVIALTRWENPSPYGVILNEVKDLRCPY